MSLTVSILNLRVEGLRVAIVPPRLQKYKRFEVSTIVGKFP
jgi:hypothetical protein